MLSAKIFEILVCDILGEEMRFTHLYFINSFPDVKKSAK